MTERIWTIQEAKARLSEILRRAEQEGPQRIGARRGYIVLSEAEWRRLKTPRPSMGRWLVDHMPQTGPLELPPREEPPRPNPFETDGAS